MNSPPRPASANFGNRTSVRLEDEVVFKELQPFADVRTERIALAEEGGLHALAQGPGVIPILGGGLESLGNKFPKVLDPPMDLRLPNPPEVQWRYLATQKIEGLTLKQWAAKRHQQEILVPSQAMRVSLFTQLFSTLSRLHDAEGPAQLIHRDLTPSNFILDEDQHLWLIDFELAHQPIRGELPDNQTLQGTRSYLAPELRSGWQPSTSSDVFQAILTLLQLESANVYLALQSGDHVAAQAHALSHLQEHSSEPWAQACIKALGPAEQRPPARVIAGLFS